MEIKKLLLALFLSFVFIITWNQIFPPVELENEIDKNAVVVDDEEEIEKELIEEISPPIVTSVITENSVSQTAITVKTSLLNLELINGATSIGNLKIIESAADGDGLKHKGVWAQNGETYDSNGPVELVTDGICNPCLLIDEKPVDFVQSGSVERISTQQIITSVSKINTSS